jgi:NADPH2:quinone reductase
MAQVVQVTRFGPPEVLATLSIPDPVAGPGEVVIAVSAVDVLLLDAVIRSGLAAAWFPITPPYIPGNGVAGRVSAVGEGVDPGWAGQAVIARTGGSGGSGGYAEQARVQAGQLVAVPDGVSLPEAAAVLHDGATALGLAGSTGIRPGEQVLILGAAGGLGILIGQLARAAGARVIAAARGKAKLDLLAELGAGPVVDYSEADWPGQVARLTGGAGPDVVFDGVGGELGAAAFEMIAGGGRFSAHGPRAAASPRSTRTRPPAAASPCAGSSKSSSGRASTSAWPGRPWPRWRRGASAPSSGRSSRCRRPQMRTWRWRPGRHWGRPCSPSRNREIMTVRGDGGPAGGGGRPGWPRSAGTRPGWC